MVDLQDRVVVDSKHRVLVAMRILRDNDVKINRAEAMTYMLAKGQRGAPDNEEQRNKVIYSCK